MLAISGQIDTAREQYFTHQVVDHKMMFSPVTKWAGRVEAGAAGTIMRKALRTATAERPGAVHLTCADDTFRGPAGDDEVVLPPLGESVTTLQVHRAPGSTVDPMVSLANARRPVVLAGISAMRAGATAALVKFAETTGIPVVTSPMSKGVFPEEHPFFAGVIDMACQQVMWDMLGESDLIVAVGFDPVELIKPWSVTAPVLHIDSVPNSDQVYRSECELVGDVSAIVEWMTSEWSGSPRWDESEIETHRKALREAYYSGRVQGRLNPTDVVDVARAAMPRETLATCDVGSHKMLVGQGWTTHQPRGTLMTNGLSSMGFGLPAAIAASMVDRTRPVIAMIGDGGFAMAATEARLAAERELPLVVVVFADGSLNRIELKQMVRGYPSTATRIEDTDLVGLASAMSCDGVRVDSIPSLEKALSSVGSLTRPLIVEARIDPSQYESQF
jgi:acetolactate synthase-1/2/3 large subunit